MALETALSIRLIRINAPIISGEAGGHWLIINIPRTKVPMFAQVGREGSGEIGPWLGPTAPL